MGEARVHNVRFFNVEPRAIHCMAYEPDHRKLALSRADSSIEIYNIANTPFIERIIPGQPQGSVEALGWCGHRLFSTGINARVVEYDLQQLISKSSVPVTAGPSWCLQVHKKSMRLAVGTEDGYINIFSITEQDLQYEKILDKQEGRILCIAWEISGDYIVTGSADAVRIWNVKTGHALHKITTGREESKKETIVWCVAITDDFTIISGDSRGKLCFWDGHKGLLKESYQSHAADVLSITLSENQSTVFCSGVDPVIVMFERINIRSSSGQNGTAPQLEPKKSYSERTLWCRSFNRRIHEHDVRAMAFCHGKLFSGGVDSYLAMSKEPKILVKYPATLQASLTAVCPKSRCLLLRYTSSLEIWRLGFAEGINRNTSQREQNRQKRQSNSNLVPVKGNGIKESSTSEGPNLTVSPTGYLHLTDKPIKLLELYSRGKEHILCAAISSDAKWLAYSTDSSIRLFSLCDLDGGGPRLEKISILPEEFSPAHRMEFSSDGSCLVLATLKGPICTFSLNSQECSVVLENLLPKTSISDTVHLLAISQDNKFIVAGDLSSNIVVWEGSRHYCSLPRYKCSPTALAVNPQSNHIVVVYSDQRVVEFSLKSKKYTMFLELSEDIGAKHGVSRQFPILHITFDPGNGDVIILHDDNTILVLNSSQQPAIDSRSKRPRVRTPMRGRDMEQTLTRTVVNRIKKYKHLVFFSWISGDEVVAVEISPLGILKQLPPVFAKKRFGT